MALFFIMTNYANWHSASQYWLNIYFSVLRPRSSAFSVCFRRPQQRHEIWPHHNKSNLNWTWWIITPIITSWVTSGSPWASRQLQLGHRSDQFIDGSHHLREGKEEKKLDLIAVDMRAVVSCCIERIWLMTQTFLQWKCH